MSATIETSHVTVADSTAENVITIEVTGKLERSDYQNLAPQVEQMLGRHDKVRMLVILRDFHGWSAGALWEDLKFDVKHFRDIDRLALVGDKKWERGMATFCKPFTTAKIQYFDLSELEAARAWIAA